ncbi:endolytic transglycosylase MltG [Deinococcus deserti]|uniref:Endolytic murein transglycosylase n=1 Tax=Deinococcus deserti (strain DSM 17065 / CIP 109153 / LMG 22923 / VCD115) TaxID=546414 RepID=C1CZZ1_DEIDV|nr:endolytic transglycosylase MltG [Deinococcus deserti]ACO45243.1 putative Aminodeoxychorismate lyase precursor [Deinococcus deserti VCD115]
MTRMHKRGMPLWAKLLLALLALLILAALAAFMYARSLMAPAGGGPYTLEVKPGDTLSAVSRTLQERKIVKNADALRLLMRQNGTAGRLKEGLYDLNGQMDLSQVAEKLAGPARIPVVNVTIPEGRRIKDLPAIFARAGFDAAGVRAALNDPSLSPYTKGKQPDLEGFVFPDTYQFRPKETPRKIVQTLLDRMNTEFTPENVARAKALGLGVRDWVILGSMVQAEAANDSEMPVIAGVFLNRLRDGIALGSDPTVAYGLGKDLPELDRSAGDFTKDTPYNTYTRGGLPAGPINNPGQAALNSVLNPERKLADGRDAVYFLHADNGKIYVNHTYAEHLRDNARYR